MKVTLKRNNSYVANYEDMYFKDCKVLVYNTLYDNIDSMEGANEELNSIRSWVDLVDFANSHGGKMFIDED
ncbi:hypothetical protein [Ligilactobacillus salivarius]|uniref:hypothetical protein n=1 Tax=Ligilactobacillus salivarius TaxID=1624 RepID=UPI001369FD89|nr:hypothetical protein [Ligilactobacillus salivarius]MYV10566.1 hypothetical protein [Ligilactobacillus salivarius]